MTWSGVEPGEGRKVDAPAAGGRVRDETRRDVLYTPGAGVEPRRLEREERKDTAKNKGVGTE